MDIAALVFSIFALLAAGWSAWGTHRQAQAAAKANATAREALELARGADAREQARLHVEERPDFEVTRKSRKHKPVLVDLSIQNNGPLAYDSVIVHPDTEDPETVRLVRGLNDPDSPADEVAFDRFEPGETLTATLVRTNVELKGNAKLKVISSRSGHEWTVVHYVTLTRPQRVYSG